MKRYSWSLSATAKAVAALLLTVSVSSLQAQGTLSTQGFGYPPGGLSTRSLGIGGATAEFDLLSSRNPASAAEIGSSVLSVQAAPEYRTVLFNDVSERSTIQRTPLVAAGLRLKRVGLLLSASTLLDRSFTTESPGTAVIGGVPTPTTDRFESRGAITELRLSAGWNYKAFALGVAAVAVTGEHSLVRTRAFPDTLLFGGVLDSTRIGFEGLGVALGATWRATNNFLIGASYRSSGPLNVLRRDSTLRSANLPSRLGLGVLYQGFAGSVLSASLEQVGWSAMNGLGTDASRAQDALNWSVGGEFEGGALRRTSVLWRVGYAQRELPFLLRDLPVSENAIHAGVGIPISSEAASLDFSVQRSFRRVQGDQARENAWGISAALTIRP
jgi:hypothetical protein